jgi:hypothetical protein
MGFRSGSRHRPCCGLGVGCMARARRIVVVVVVVVEEEECDIFVEKLGHTLIQS